MAQMEAMEISDEEASVSSSVGGKSVEQQQQWHAIEQLSIKLSQLAAHAKVHGAREEEIGDAQELVQSLLHRLPHSENFESEQVPALLMELRNVPTPAPVLFRPQAAIYGSRRELVEKFADEKKAVVPPTVIAVGKTDVSVAAGIGAASDGVRPAQAGVVCSFCGTQSSPEWRKGPNGPKTLCNACGLVYSKMVKTRKVRQTAK